MPDDSTASAPQRPIGNLLVVRVVMGGKKEKETMDKSTTGMMRYRIS